MTKALGKYLKRLRVKNDLSLRALEKEVGISNAYLSQIETGKRGIPTLRILTKLSDYYHVDVYQLLAKAIKDIKHD